MAHTPKDIVMRVGVGEVYAMMVAEGSAWSPDVAKDMVSRLDELWRNAIETAVDAGLIDTSPLPLDDDDDLDDDLDDDDDGDDDYDHEDLLKDLDELFSDKEVD